MNINKLASDFEYMFNELGDTYPTQKWLLIRSLHATELNLFRGRIEYDEVKKRKPEVHVEFFEPHVPLTQDEKLAFKKAASLNWQIGRKLGKIRRGEV